MAESSAQPTIRGLDIDKLAKGFADVEIILKRFVTVSTTAAREIRWYSKTAGFIATPTVTAGVTGDSMANVSFKARPMVAEQSWTRNTSYIRKYFVESPLLSDEDIKDTDIDILATNIRDLVRTVERKVETRIWDVISENRTAVNINLEDITHEWDDPTNCNPVNDLLSAKGKIAAYGYSPEGAILLLNHNVHRYLLSWLINTKGANIPSFSSDRIKDGIVMEILGLNVIVTDIVTADYGMVFVPQRAATWKSFMPISTATIDDPGIGKKIRVWEEGECLLTDPRACCLLKNVGPS